MSDNGCLAITGGEAETVRTGDTWSRLYLYDKHICQGTRSDGITDTHHVNHQYTKVTPSLIKDYQVLTIEWNPLKCLLSGPKCIFVIFDEMANVKISQAGAAATISSHQFCIKIRAASYRCWLSLWSLKCGLGSLSEHLGFLYFENTNQLSGKWLAMASLCK